MNTNTKLMPTIAAMIFTTIVCGSIASAQQAAPSTPFASGVRINVNASKISKHANGYYDLKTQKIGLTVTFVNKDMRQTYEGFTAIISVFGQFASNTKVKKVLLEETVTLLLPPTKTQEHITQEITTRFDKIGYKYGYSYDGWIIVVKDPAGKVVQVKSSSAPLEKYTELASKLVLGKCYDSKLKPVADPGYATVYSGY
jgi:hypothetical protein